jgi:ADP-heptose:LPS heptosyltransferase
VGVLSLPALVALLSTARLVVANDTGPLHVAEALNRPTIGLYWGLNLLHSAPLLVKEHRALVSWQMACPICGRGGFFETWPTRFEDAGTCNHAVSMLDNIEPREVIATAEELLLNTAETLSS